MPPPIGWAVHLLGGIDLNYIDPTSSTYFVEDMSDPPEEQVDEAYAPLNDGAGVVLTHFAIGGAPHTINLIALGNNQDAADANRNALQAVIDAAISGSTITYEYKKDAAQAENTIWLVKGGIVRERWRTGDGNLQLFGLGTKYVSPAKVTLTLSKN